MTFTVNSEVFLQPLVLASDVVESKSTNPVLSCVLIEFVGSLVRVTGTDNEMILVSEAQTMLDLEPGVSLKVAVNARKIVEIVKALESDQLSLALSSNGLLTLESRGARFQLTALPAEDFPEGGVLVDQGNSVVVDAKFLRDKFKQVSFAMAAQDVRPFLKGLYMHSDQEAVKLVATDGHRLSVGAFAPAEGRLEHDVIIPRKAVNQILKLVSQRSEAVKLSISNTHLRVDLDGCCFVTKLMDGKYPDYTRVIPRDFSEQVIVDREDLRKSLTRVAILSNDTLRCVRFSFSQGVLDISAANYDSEEASESLPCDYSGPDVSIGLNANYVLEALSHTVGEVAVMKFIDANNSVLIQSELEPDLLFVIMPMRI